MEKNRSEILSLGLLLPSILAAGSWFSLPIPSVCLAALFQINLLFFKEIFEIDFGNLHLCPLLFLVSQSYA